SGSSAYTTTATARFLPPNASLTSVSVNNGDRMIIEVGARQNASSTNRTFTHVYGSNFAGDLPFDQTSTTNLNGWIQFSQNIKFMISGNVNGVARIQRTDTSTQSG